MASFEDYVNFFTAVNKQIVADEEDGESQLKCIYQPVLKKLKEKILQKTIIFLPHCEMAILQVFSTEPLLANVSFIVNLKNLKIWNSTLKIIVIFINKKYISSKMFYI